ncbi:PAS domain S-box protein [Microcoleus sp. FACHB-1515]|uniref:PAS domain S-box protein n=1 Tax=Cyanophyceae TaxID=3028117 RepID=UPI00168461BC|nr:PAS domain S-box protein [Microcoleus sp. FACHB-1515]MBD2092010.1 PAS domain S-box protein [Microcoleus sp. FACHB-1515]
MSDAPPQNSTAPIPANETKRLAALHRYKILDTPPEAAFDRITGLAARLFNMPIALISLVDESRAWFKSCIGFEAQEVPRDATLCSFAVLTDEPLIIPDTRLDDRFACNPFVQQEPGVRFYAGAPLMSDDGFNLGTLCLLDSQPHDPLTAEQQATLVDLAAMVVDELELRLAARKVAQVDAALMEITQGVSMVMGSAFFDALVLHFAKVLDVDYAYIGVVEGDDPKLMRTIALCAQGQPADNVEYLLQDTPCWEVIEQRKICSYPCNVQAHFPHAPLLKPLAIESYVAVPFFDSDGVPLGLLGVMDGKPLENVHLAESLLAVFASRVSTEFERQQIEQKRDRFFAVASDLQVMTRSDGFFEWVSPSVERLLGWTVEEITSRPWTEFVHPDDLNASTLEADSLFSGQKTLAFENRYRHKDGSYRWLRWRAQLEGHVLYGSAVDITAAKRLEVDRLQAEVALRDSEEQFRLMADVVPQIVWITDAQGRVEFFNQQWSNYTGVPYEPITAAEIVDNFIHPDDAERTMQMFGEAQRLGRQFAIEHRVRSASGDYRWFIVRAEPYFDPQTGEIIRWFGASLDIHDRKIAEAALQASEAQSRNILESIDDGFLALDENWRFTYMNKAAETLLNFMPDDVIGENFWEVFPGLEGSDFEQLHQSVMRDRVAGSLVAFYPDHDRWYEVRSYPAAQGITIYFRNVTDRIQADAALRQSEERYRMLFESIDEGFCVVEVICNADNRPIDYRILEINPAFEQQTGLQQAVGKTARELNLEDHWIQTYGHVAITGESVRFESGSEVLGRWFDVYACCTGEPEARKVAIVFKDISDRKQAEITIQASNDRLKLLAETANDLLVTIDPKAFLASLLNKVAAHLQLEIYVNYLFREDKQRLELHAHGGISEALAQAARYLDLGQAVCGYVVQQRRPVVVDCTVDPTDPMAIPVQAEGIRAYASHPLKIGDRVIGTLGLGTRQRDRFTQDELDLMQAVAAQVSAALERSRLITELQDRAEALDRANHIKDEFLAVLSHELRTPLNPILGWTRLLQSGKLDATRQREALATIERNAKLQTQLIEDLLDISRIMQGKLSLTAVPVSLSFVIEAAIETVRLAVEAKHIQLTLDLASAVAHVSGDAARLQQVIWNLLTNAVKFTPNNGQISVELRQIDRIAQIRVIDTGKGINPQFLPHIFEYFRQEDSSTTRKFGGLGLGLAIVRQIVELHGGTVKADSPGEHQGAIFTVQLPVIEQRVSTRSPNHNHSPDLKNLLSNLQILVVDDDDDTRQFQAFVLEQNGATVTAVASGLEALEAIDRATPDLIVSDIGMADMDGYTLIRQIRSRPIDRGGDILAIALTAYASDGDQQKAFQAGFQAHLTKPIEPEVLVKHIVRLRSGSAV